MGKRQQSKEQVEAEALRDGAAAPEARSVQRLFVEADGLMVPLQREARRRTEIKAAVAYRGTRKIGVDRHGRERRETLGTVSFTGRGPGEPFWEQAWGQFGQHYQLEAIEQVVLGGDGADWIWRLSNGEIVYDNVYGGSEDIDAANPQEIGGGSIVIHS